VLRILQRIPDDAENIALPMSALRNKQSWRSIRSILPIARTQNPAMLPDVRAAINALFQQLENPSAYNAINSLQHFAAFALCFNNLLRSR